MRRPFSFFMLAGVAAMLAALVVYSALKQREAAVQRATAQTTQIVVAASTLPLGSKIEPASVKLTRWSRDSIPPGSYTDPQAVVGTYVRSSFVENEPIVSTKLFTGAKTAGVMPLLIPPGMRAMSVPVDEVSDVAGFVQPDARVDVVVSLTGTGGTSEKPFSKTILENVQVLAVAQEIEGDKDKPQVVKVVTLLVNPEEAERLALASREGGTVRLAIRNYEDSKIVLTHGTDIQGLMRAFSAAPITTSIRSQSVSARSEAPRKPTIDVQILRNGKTSESISFIANSPVHAAASHGHKAAKTIASAKPEETAQADEPVHSASSAVTAAPAKAEDSAHTLAATPDSKSLSAAMYVPKPKVIDVP
jgi:pilus assembly protein CpaB